MDPDEPLPSIEIGTSPDEPNDLALTPSTRNLSASQNEPNKLALIPLTTNLSTSQNEPNELTLVPLTTNLSASQNEPNKLALVPLTTNLSASQNEFAVESNTKLLPLHSKKSEASTSKEARDPSTGNVRSSGRVRRKPERYREALPEEGKEDTTLNPAATLPQSSLVRPEPPFNLELYVGTYAVECPAVQGRCSGHDQQADDQSRLRVDSAKDGDNMLSSDYISGGYIIKQAGDGGDGRSPVNNKRKGPPEKSFSSPPPRKKAQLRPSNLKPTAAAAAATKRLSAAAAAASTPPIRRTTRTAAAAATARIKELSSSSRRPGKKVKLEPSKPIAAPDIYDFPGTATADAAAPAIVATNNDNSNSNGSGSGSGNTETTTRQPTISFNFTFQCLTDSDKVKGTRGGIIRFFATNDSSSDRRPFFDAFITEATGVFSDDLSFSGRMIDDSGLPVKHVPDTAA
ncbi:hypothetical protein B0H66DRAFT_605726 [Apodospora peruviana]|uniref:Uncharacterized protein n=1 Tax=Apodospora peruviana TaxID=516989 RepID=A0AAE0HY77_9PEZI|nr:hypothetical protein B0H66DRAFT_605726 [Apodospora peruviana]